MGKGDMTMKKRERKIGNGGFSLVELIIVIAIMAVLIGVMAPAYLGYVEKSRKSTDVSAMDSIIGAMQVCAVDTSLQLKTNDVIIATMTGTGTTYKAGPSASATTTNAAAEEMLKICGSYALKSSWNGKTPVIITGTISDSGSVTFAMTDAAAKAEVVGYAPAMADKVGALPTPPET